MVKSSDPPTSFLQDSTDRLYQSAQQLTEVIPRHNFRSQNSVMSVGRYPPTHPIPHRTGRGLGRGNWGCGSSKSLAVAYRIQAPGRGMGGGREGGAVTAGDKPRGGTGQDSEGECRLLGFQSLGFIS